MTIVRGSQRRPTQTGADPVVLMRHQNHFFIITAVILHSIWFYCLKILISVGIKTESKAQQFVQHNFAVL